MPNKAFKASGSDTRVLFISVRAAALTWCWASSTSYATIAKTINGNKMQWLPQ